MKLNTRNLKILISLIILLSTLTLLPFLYVNFLYYSNTKNKLSYEIVLNNVDTADIKIKGKHVIESFPFTPSRAEAFLDLKKERDSLKGVFHLKNYIAHGEEYKIVKGKIWTIRELYENLIKNKGSLALKLAEPFLPYSFQLTYFNSSLIHFPTLTFWGYMEFIFNVSVKKPENNFVKVNSFHYSSVMTGLLANVKVTASQLKIEHGLTKETLEIGKCLKVSPFEAKVEVFIPENLMVEETRPSYFFVSPTRNYLISYYNPEITSNSLELKVFEKGNISAFEIILFILIVLNLVLTMIERKKMKVNG